MQPDKPDLCRFWLQALIGALGTTSLHAAFFPLQLLLLFLWKYTFSSVPRYLRPQLLTGVQQLAERLQAGQPAEETELGSDHVGHHMCASKLDIVRVAQPAVSTALHKYTLCAHLAHRYRRAAQAL